jgi:mono/diheme cytochrome c family protein
VTKRIIAAFSLLASCVVISQTASAADIARGQKLAAEYCAKCHRIRIGAPSKLQPPSLASIAGYRRLEYIRGRIVSPDLHTNMPDVSWALQSDDVDDLLAYILSLEKKK